MTELAPAETLALLERLSSKPGVRSTLIISRTTGAIVQSSGFDNSEQEMQHSESLYDQKPVTTAPETGDTTGLQPAEKVARAVFTFVKAAEMCSRDLGGDDDIRLLRLRLKRQELVIVPNTKYLLVVAHDTT